MGLVSTWLNGIGLGHAIPAFKAAGIVTPSALAELELGHYEALGVCEPNDRKKLFYLVQRIKMAVDQSNAGGGDDDSGDVESESDEDFESDRGHDRVGRQAYEEGRRDGGRNRHSTRRMRVEELDRSREGYYNGDHVRDDDHQSEYDDDDYCSEGSDDEGEHLRETALVDTSRRAATVAAALEASSSEELWRSSEESESSLPSPPPDEEDGQKEEDLDLQGSQLHGGRRRSARLMKTQPQREQKVDVRSGRNSTSSRDKRKQTKATVSEVISSNGVDENRNHNYATKKMNDSPVKKSTAKTRSGSAGIGSTRDARNETKVTKKTASSVLGRARNKTSSSAAAEEQNAVKSTKRHTKNRTVRAAEVAPATGYNRRDADSTFDGYEDDSDWDDPQQSPAAEKVITGRTKTASARSRGATGGDSTEGKSSSAQLSKRRLSRRLQDQKQNVQTQSAAIRPSVSLSDASDEESIGNISAMSQRSNISAMSQRSGRSRASISSVSTSNTRDKRRKRQSAPVSSRASSSATMSTRRRKSSAASSSTATSSRSNEASLAAKLTGELRRKRNTDVDTSSQLSNSVDSDLDKSLSYADDEEDSVQNRIPQNQTHSLQQDAAHKSVKKSSSRTQTKRRYESKIQNPSISTRTGKNRLSTIPSNSVAPMSPLLTMSSSQLEQSVGARQVVTEKKPASKSKIKRTGSSGSGQWTSSSSLEQGSLSGSDSEKRRRSAPLDQRKWANESTDQSSAEVASKGTEASVETRRNQNRMGDSRARSRSASSRSSQKSGRKSRRDVSSAASTGSSTKRRSRRSGAAPRSNSPVRTTRAPSPMRLTRGESAGALGRSFDVDGLGGDDLNISKTSSTGPIFVHGVQEDNSWGAQVSSLREDNDADHEIQSGAMDECSDEEEMRIRVLVRKRPMSKREASSGEVDVIHPLQHASHGRILVYQPKTRVDLTKEVETLPFSFDNVFNENANNVQIYEKTVRNLIPGVFEGKWASVFAYGQTGSGKTFTMMGCTLTGTNSGTQGSSHDNSNLGLYYLAAQDVFRLANVKEYRHLSVGASLFEIYGGKLFDLLNGRKPIKCLENHRGKVCFPGLSEHPVGSAHQLMDVIETGALNRSTGSTSANADSSRSHAVLQLSLRKQVGRKSNVEHGRLTFIDLAGSERGADTNKASRTTRLEGAEINTSLLALKEVIRALATGDSLTHIPFRGSKLTQVLKESFVGKNSRTVMVACVAPNMGNCEHTLNTIRYADRVKERDPETGKLSAMVAASCKVRSKKTAPIAGSAPQFPSGESTDVVPTTSETQLHSSFDDRDMPPEDEGWISSDHDDFITTDPADEESSQGDGSEILDKLLESPADDDTTDVADETPVSFKGLEFPSERPSTNKEAATSLIATHRSIMTGMLGMVKHEMSLVNCTDADRDTIDEYLLELEKVQEKQLSMISTLRESLLEYYGSREISRGGSHTKEDSSYNEGAEVVEALSDDTFEDLRD